MTEGWGGQVAECLFLRAARIGAVNGPDTHDAPHGDLDELHRLVSARLASDPALAQLEREAAAGIESERTKRRVRDAVEQALEDDQGFADELTQAVGTLSSAGGGRQPSFSKPASETTRTFDPFDLVPLFPGRLRKRSSGWLIIPGIAMALLVVAVTTVEGTLGTAADVRWIEDIGHAFSPSVPVTEPNFPLLRDFSSIFLFLVIAAGVVLLHKQWQYMSVALPRLRELHVIKPLRRPTSTLASRMLGVDRLVRGAADYAALDRLNERMARFSTRTKIVLSGMVIVVAFVLATLAGNALDTEMFVFLAPTDADQAQREQWLMESRKTWWAGPDHPMGLALFGFMTWFAMALVLACNVVGLTTVYLAVGLYFVADFDADWYDRDGRYGWMPVARICRTMYLCLVLLGGGISFVVVVLGVNIAFSMIGLIALYVLFIPVFTVVPWAVFRKIERRARHKRLQDLARASQRYGGTDPAQARTFVDEFARCRGARINPMRLRAVPSGAFLSVVLLPILLTALQIYTQAGLGRF
jgi:hypothetical protein